MQHIWKDRIINVLLLVGSLLLLVLFLEGFLRFSGIERLESRRPHLHQPSAIPGVHYEFVPNLENARGYNWERISTNNLGFRGPDLDPSKPTIAILGDSFAFGFGLNDNQTNAEPLREAFPGYNVLNLGVNGYNVEQEVRAYLAKFSNLKPTLVIMEFVFNDFGSPSILTDEAKPEVYEQQGYLEKGAVADENLRKAITQSGTLVIPGKFWLQTHSAIFNFVERRTKWLPFRQHATDHLTETVTDQDLTFYDTWLSKLAENVPDAKKIFVIWPENGGLHLGSRRKLHAMAEAKGFAVLDLYDVFGMRYPTLPWDWHPDASAQKRGGEILAEFIRYEKLLPESAPGK